MSKYTVREIAENEELWKTYANPNGEPDDDMTTKDKMKMIVDLWPESINEDDDEAKRLLANIRRGKASGGRNGKYIHPTGVESE